MRLLVPIDGSASAKAALKHALWLAQKSPSSTIVLINVQNRESLGLSELHAETANDHETADKRSAEILATAAKACEDAQIKFKIKREFGPIPDTIATVAQETEVDQIVMGTRGLGGVAGLILGSVAMGVVHRTDIPVTLVQKNYRPHN